MRTVPYGSLFPCHILERQQSSSSLLPATPDNDKNASTESTAGTTPSLFTAIIQVGSRHNHSHHRLLVRDIPVTAIRSVTDKWLAISEDSMDYREDESLPAPFRHPAMLLDDVFPSNWKDLNLV
jgi:hypothetical protein